MSGLPWASRVPRAPPQRRADRFRSDKELRARSRPHPSPSPDRVRARPALPPEPAATFCKLENRDFVAAFVLTEFRSYYAKHLPVVDLYSSWDRKG
jgi:hypothetical protein